MSRRPDNRGLSAGHGRRTFTRAQERRAAETSGVRPVARPLTTAVAGTRQDDGVGFAGQRGRCGTPGALWKFSVFSCFGLTVATTQYRTFTTLPVSIMRNTLLLVVVGLLFGCAGSVNYVRPTSAPTMGSNSKIIDKPRDVIWNAAVPELGKQFFVINNLDKSSGLINISYSGDPEKYIDCGRINSYVKNARGERTYNFAGAKAQQSYEVMDPGTGLYLIDRRMSVEGRMNLVFEEVSLNQTRITANTRYIIQRQILVRNLGSNASQTMNDTLSINSGGTGSFPSNSNGEPTQCVSTGELEREVLSLVR